jgi:hypothetical protein
MEEHGQYYHYETYGRNESTAKHKEGSNLESILGEAFREPKYSTHIDQDDTLVSPPEIAFSDIEFEEKTTKKDKLEIQKQRLKELAEAYAKAKKLRYIDGCIIAGVVSYPPGTTLETRNFIFVSLVLPFLKKKWGKNLRCVVTHNDEYFWDDEEKKKEPHYQDHFYVIPDADGDIRLTCLHEGNVAKREAIAGKVKPPDKEKQKEIWKAKMPVKYTSQIDRLVQNYDLTEWQIISVCLKMGNDKNFEMNNIDNICKEESKKAHSDIAYRETMRKVQDEFFLEVGEKAGWKRSTVKGIRYTREEVKKWKENQRKLRKQNQEANEKKEAADLQLAEAKRKNEEADQQLAEAKRKNEEAESKSQEIMNNTHKDHEMILSALKVDFNKVDMPEPKIVESAKSFFRRISGWLKGKIYNIVKKEKELNQKEIDIRKKETKIDKQKLAIDTQLARLVGDYGEENQIKQSILLLQNKLKEKQQGKGQTTTKTDKKIKGEHLN